ncbi:acyl-CoA dehydrogenase [Halioxenophilus sp. WMMB6]|uniref:acyl-CoA dehydrogenase family protein n=1 Tax=Halioxenophilus sp. WMMB6 TaxID=3073815 RepID=UPI00295F39D5|nr:acyl-CoA dehydrogenase [Halioxenophilus sp. WMMB6]
MSDFLVNFPNSTIEPPMTEEEAAVRDACNKFAREVMRPAGIKLDKLSAEEMIAPGSKFWDVMEGAKDLGLSVKAMAEIEPVQRARLFAIATEEMSWGDVGLAAAVLVQNMPALYALIANNQEMLDYCDGKRGCWAITEPDHGSDNLDPGNTSAHPKGEISRPNCVAQIQGDKIIINGQKSAWVSGAMTAEICALYCHTIIDGRPQQGIAVIVPLDAPGVSRGKPLEKMGARCLNQGELFFDNVEVPISHLLVGPDQYKDFLHHTLSNANPYTGLVFVGAGRAAYELALAYAHDRKAGGVPLIKHQNVQYRLFHMFRKLEAARALLHRTLAYNASAETPSLIGACSSKITATQFGFEVANEALQIFGGNGMTKEYPLEKLLRDARAGLIADGCNEFLAIAGGRQLMNSDLF